MQKARKNPADFYFIAITNKYCWKRQFNEIAESICDAPQWNDSVLSV